MAYIPQNAVWYVCEMVEEIVIDGDSRNVVHLNLVLIRADSPDEAYDRALALGKKAEANYESPSGRKVSICFRGLRSLSVVHDELEHGVELLYSEILAVPEEKIARLITPKEQLSVFRPIVPSEGPDYSSRDILEEAIAIVRRNLSTQETR